MQRAGDPVWVSPGSTASSAGPVADHIALEVCAELRTEPACADATIIAVSGITRNIVESRALASGFDSYLLKPVEKGLLEAVLQGAVR